MGRTSGRRWELGPVVSAYRQSAVGECGWSTAAGVVVVEMEVVDVRLVGWSKGWCGRSTRWVYFNLGSLVSLSPRVGILSSSLYTRTQREGEAHPGPLTVRLHP